MIMNINRYRKRNVILAALLLMAGIAQAQVNIGGNVYGGCDIGQVSDSATVVVNGGTIGDTMRLKYRILDNNAQFLKRIEYGNVYGGGNGNRIIGQNSNGSPIYDVNAGRVKGNTNVTIGGNAVVRRAVYGGGNIGTVGDFVVNPTTGLVTVHNGGGRTIVTITDYALVGPKLTDLTSPTRGELDTTRAYYTDLGWTGWEDAHYVDSAFKYLGGNEGWVFGASRGVSGGALKHLSFVDTTIVTINGHAQVMTVFGGGENGHVQTGTNVIIGGDAVVGGIPLHGSGSITIPAGSGAYSGATFTAAVNETQEDGFGVGPMVFRGNVFGGGKGTDFISWFANPKYCYTSGRVYGNTTLTVEGNAKIYNRVYGGGAISSVGTFTYETSSDPDNHTITGIVGRTGHAYVYINGGYIGSYSATAGLTGRNSGDVFGGGRGYPGRPRRPQSDGPYGLEPLTILHQAVDEAYVGHTHVIVNGGTIYNSVYGGGASGHVQGDSHVTIKQTSSTATKIGHDLGTWHGNVYGGGGGTARYKEPGKDPHHSVTAGRVFGDAYVTIQGGRIHHNVYGGGALASVGTYDTSSDATTPYLGNGSITINITGGTIGTDGNDNGMVFGSGRGEIAAPGNFLDTVTYAAYTHITIGTDGGDFDDLKINGSVYGSGENGHVYMQSQIDVKSGTIGCSASDYARYLANTEYYADSLKNFPNRGNVYGAGCGTDKYTIVTGTDPITKRLYNPNAGFVQGNTFVNIYGGYISHNVYGGGAMASVGALDHSKTYAHLNTEAMIADSASLSWPYNLRPTPIPDANSNLVTSGMATVNIFGGHIGTLAAPMTSGNVFGSCRGDVGPLGHLDTLAMVRKTAVNINFNPFYTDFASVKDSTKKVIIGSVYGSGEDGFVYEDTKVTFDNGIIGGSVFGGGSGTSLYKDRMKNPATGDYYSDSIYVRSITAGKVYGNTEVEINGGYITHNVYGGGNLASVGKGNYIGYGEMTGLESGPEDPYEDSGKCTVTINGGTIGTNGYLVDGYLNGFVYGSSKGTTFVNVTNSPRYDYSRDFFLGYANETEVNIGSASPSVVTTPVVKGTVFGGGENGHVRWNTNVTVNKGSVGVDYDEEHDNINDPEWLYRGNVYGAGRGMDKIGIAGHVNEYCNSAGSVTLNTTVTVNGGTIYRNVYGGGSMATVGPPPTGSDYTPGTSLCNVIVNGGTIGDLNDSDSLVNGGHVFGGTRGVIDPNVVLALFCNVSNTLVDINDGADIKGNIYGGGEIGQVKQNAKVDMSGGIAEGTIYGGGKGDTDSIRAALVWGNTEVDMSGGTVERSIYGGGQMGSVGTFTAYDEVIYNEGQSNQLTVKVPKTCADNTGLAKVVMSGGSVGLAGSLMPWEDHNVEDDDRGWIFCGGQGVADSTLYPKAIALGVVDSTYLEIRNTTTGETLIRPVVTASVYGGSENGLVLGNTHVMIAGGQIGTGLVSRTTTTPIVGTFDDPYGEDLWTAAITAVNNGTIGTALGTGGALHNKFHECDTWTYASPYYVYDIFADPSEYPTHPTFNEHHQDYHTAALEGTNGHSFFGNVFGGGSGYYPFAIGVWRKSAGQVRGNTLVEITGGHILTNVYGGNETTDVLGKCTINMSGGTVGVPRTVDQIKAHPTTCNIYGAGMGDFRSIFDAFTDVNETEVNITGGTVFGSVFGGSEEGHVVGHATVNIGEEDGDSNPILIGTTGLSGYDGHVLGGGKGNAKKLNKHDTEHNTYYQEANFASGRVGGNATVTMTEGTVLGNLYGGGLVGRVGVGRDGTFDTYITGQVYDSLNGHGLAKVVLSGGTVGNHFRDGLDMLMSDEKSGNVYGGGCGDPNEFHEDDLGRVANSTAEISGNPTIYGSVFGGGQMANAGYWMGYDDGWYADGTSGTLVTIAGTPTIGTTLEFDHTKNFSHTDYDTINGVRKVSHPRTGNVYGGGQGRVRLKVDSEGHTIGTGYPEGLEHGHCGNTWVYITETSTSQRPTILSSVYGGSEQGAVWGNTHVTIAGGLIGQQNLVSDSLRKVGSNWVPYEDPKTGFYSFGSVYGGSYGLDAYKHMHLQEPALGANPSTAADSIYNLAGRIYGNTYVEIAGGIIRGNVYGGGELGTVATYSETHSGGFCEVKVSGGEIGPLDYTGLNAYVFGGGKGFAEDPKELRKSYINVTDTRVTVEGGKIHGSVFGGGSDAHTLGDAEVNIHSLADIGTNGLTTWDGNIFGGGRNYRNTNNTNGRVAGNINITMDGGSIQGTIFGGGRLALTGVDVNGDPFLTAPGGHEYDSINHGLVTINITSDTIFSVVNPTQDSIVYNPSIGNDNGHQLLYGDESVGDIFGSGKGDTKDYDDIWGGRVANVQINISGQPRIYGSVFGGGEMASVGYWYNDNSNPSHPKSPFYAKSGVTNVTIEGAPEIGTDMEFSYNYAHGTGTNAPSYWTVFDDNHNLIHTCTGNVYGGSQGDVDTLDCHWVSMARSRKAYVTINMKEGGIIKSRVFGGAEQGTVAGNTYVTVKGKGTIGSWANYDVPAQKYLFGGVYGGGYGSHNPIFNGTTTSYAHDPIVNDSTDYFSDTLWTASHLAGRTYGNTLVKVLGATIQGDVYGGASYAYIGGYGANPNGNATLYIGDETQSSDPGEESTVGTTINGSVFGANNHSGTPYGDVNVHIYHTAHTIENAAPTTPEGGWTHDSIVANTNGTHTYHFPQDYALKEVFGGGNQAHFWPNATRGARSTTVHVHRCENTIKDLYGGGNAADVGKLASNANANANLIVEGGRFDRVFGGGNGAGENNPGANIYGSATTDIDGGVINYAFGGGNEQGIVLSTQLDFTHGTIYHQNCDDFVDEIFGGSNESPIIGDVITNLYCGDGYNYEYYGGTNNADIWGNVTLNVYGGNTTNLYGGSKGNPEDPEHGPCIKKYPTEEEIEDNPEAYPAGLAEFLEETGKYGEGGTVKVNLYGGTIENVFGGNKATGNIEGLITINVIDTVGTCPLDITNIYGASDDANYTPKDPNLVSPVINIVHIDAATGIRNNVYGGAKGISATVTSNPVVNIGYQPSMDDYIPQSYLDDHMDDLLPLKVHIGGNVFGGGEYSTVDGSTHVNMVSGVVGDSTELHNHLGGDSLFYGIQAYTLNGGRVYGGGQGDDANKNYGKVTGNTYVNVSGTAKIRNCVYGGGMLGSVGSGVLTDKTTGVATVTISGGKIGPLDGSGTNAYVYGGGRGKDGGSYELFANVDSTSVIVCDSARIYGSIFGGAEDGHVLGNVHVQLKKSLATNPDHDTIPIIGTNGLTSWDGNIFGGGRNYLHTNYTAGRVAGNIRIDMSDGQLKGNVYGGGRLGLTGMKADGNPIGDDHGIVTINISGGTVGSVADMATIGNVFGGGKGMFLDPDNPAVNIIGADMWGRTKETHVNISGGTDTHIYGSVYGGGEQAYTMENTNVTVSGGIIGSELPREDDPEKTRYNGSVFGGGKGIEEGYPYLPMQKEAGIVHGNTTVRIEGGQVMENVFGGGELGSVGQYLGGETPVAEGNTYVTVTGGQVGPLDGTGLNGYVYGGSQGIGNDPDGKFCFIADVINTNVTIDIPADADPDENRIWGSVFGGGADGHVMGDAHVEMKSGIVGTDGTTSWDGNIFGGGRNYLHTNLTAGRVGGNITVDMTGGTLMGSIFGGGRLGVTGISAVLYSEWDELGNPIFWSVPYMLEGDDYGNVTVTVSGGTVGNSSNILTWLATPGHTSMGDVFGGGKGDASSPEFARVKNDSVVIKGTAQVLGNVYGGGELANVGWYETSAGALSSVEGTGKACVTITGNNAQVGIEQIGANQATILNGSVFGGGLGKAGGKLQGNAHLYANVDSTHVTISGDAMIYNTVFGGGDNGHVVGSTVVDMTGGTVGQKNTLKELITSNQEQYSTYIYTGNVLGGGKGITEVSSGVYNDTTGIVFGNTNVTISGGTVRHGVYGGGGLSHVGTFAEKTSDTIRFASGTGVTNVTISGNAHIGPKKEDLTQPTAADLTPARTGFASTITEGQYIDSVFKYLGGNCGLVFGAGCGLVGLDNLTYNDSTFVCIAENAQVTGSVFGGGENGHVARHTKVDIKGGIIGGVPLHGTSYALPDTNAYYSSTTPITLHLASKDSEIYEDKYGTGRRVFRGEVYGGGKGTDYNSEGDYSHTAARVLGNTSVTVRDSIDGDDIKFSPTIYGRVYGGGSIASVGKFTYHKTSFPAGISLTDSIQRISYKKGTGITNVTISGGTIGTDGMNNGDVVGGGRGLVGNPHGFDTINKTVPDGADQVVRLAYVNSTNVTIDNKANVRSNVYGGSINGHVYGDTHVNMDGGTVGYAYMDTDTLKVHGGWHSNVYGGGGGTGHYKVTGKPDHLSITSGRVYGNTNVTVTDGHVYHNVYGGGPIASVGTYDLRKNHEPEVEGTGTATVTITGGTIGLDSYGEGIYDLGKFGNDGNNNGMVFGSGRGEIDTINAFADSLSFVIHSVVNIGTEDGNFNDLKIRGSVYGSGENGHVYKTGTVNVYSGTIGCSVAEFNKYSSDSTKYVKQLKHFNFRGNVYGAGCGTDQFTDIHDGKKKYNPQSGIVWGNAVVNVSGGYISRNVYGAGAMASVGYYTSTERHLGDTLSWPCELDFKMGGITEVNITGGHIGTYKLREYPTASGCVYGSARGEAGSRYEMVPFSNVKEAYVTVNFTPETGTTFNNDTKKVIIGSVFGSGESGHVYDTTSVTITNGLIVGSVFGAGDGTAMYKDSLLVLRPNGTPTNPDDYYWKDDTLVHSITAGKVFGNTCVTVEDGYILHNVYGGGNLASVGKGNYNGEKPEGYVKDYGESGNFNLTTTKSGRSHVRIYGGQIGTDGKENGHVFGSSRGLVFPNINLSPRYNYSHDFFLGYTNKSFVTIGESVVPTPTSSSPRIYGSVFGGGQDGHVRLNTEVTINDAEIGVAYGDGSLTLAEREYVGNVYGAGRGIDKIGTPGHENEYCPSSGSVTRNTHVIIKGGHIHRDVFGGGSLATLGPPVATYYDPSFTTVDVEGGMVGDSLYVVDNNYGGNVFGSSRGEIAAPGHQFDNMATVVGTRVNIGKSGATSGPRIWGSVYGSGDNGHVKDSTEVYVYSGTIGALGQDVDIAYRGNVFGGGSGMDTYLVGTTPTHNPKAGKVSGYAHVFIDGEHALVHGSVYGGGNTSEVAKERVVTIINGTVKGNVFGGCNSGIAENTPFTSLKTVNVRGGHICGNVFGGSYNAKEKHPDVPSSPWPSDDKNNYWTSFVNITGGQIDNNVYAAGYGGDVDGSVCVNVGLTAVLSSPTTVNQTIGSARVNTFYNVGLDPEDEPEVAKLLIGGNVFGGSYIFQDGGGTLHWDHRYDITGYSTLFIDGEGYHMTTEVTPGTAFNSLPDKCMNIDGGIYGSGSFCESGAKGREIIIRNYGARLTVGGEGDDQDNMAGATRTLTTLQRGGIVLLDNSNIKFEGTVDISGQDLIRDKFGVLQVDKGLFVANASGIVLGTSTKPAYMDSIHSVRSLYLKSGQISYNQLGAGHNTNWETVGIQGTTSATASLYRLTNTGTPSTPVITPVLLTAAQENVIIFKNASKLWVRYRNSADNKLKYGELQGFFRVSVEDAFYPIEGNESFAYARPKLTSKVNDLPDYDTVGNTWNAGDGGFLSYIAADNDFTKKDYTALNYTYPKEGDDGGAEYTKTKQYPYFNVSVVAKDDPVHYNLDTKDYRLWALPSSTAKKWYVDGRGIGTGGWGQDSIHAKGWGHYPDKPKQTITGNVGIYKDSNGGYFSSFDPANDIIFVVGPVEALNENVELNQSVSNTLKLYRYPGGHTMSNGEKDAWVSTNPSPNPNVPASTDYNGLGSGITNGPGANCGAMIHANKTDAAFVMENVKVDGLFVHDGSEPLEIPTIYTSTERYNVGAPLVVTETNSKLTLKGGTILQGGYNKTDAAETWYPDPDYEADVAQGGGIFVANNATVNVEGLVTIMDNKQKKGDGEIFSNVYLPRFRDTLVITAPLDARTEIGVTSPRRNSDWATRLRVYNTFSPVAVIYDTCKVATIQSAWRQNNIRDDQDWFFGNEHHTTYYKGSTGGDGASRKLYFGWTWANVVREQPAATDYEESPTSITVKSEKGLAWLISKSLGMNGVSATNFDGVTIQQTGDFDMEKYVWVPIGEQGAGNQPFAGTFDGQGHLIKNLNIEYIGKGDYKYELLNYGLFGYVRGGTVKRAFVMSGEVKPDISVSLTTEDFAVGGLVGCLDGGTVCNSETALKVNAIDNDASGIVTGGLVGLLNAGEVHSSMSMAEIITKAENRGAVGGMVGKATGGWVSNSFVNADFTLDETATAPVAGGLLGTNAGAGATVRNCYVNWTAFANSAEASHFRGIVSNAASSSNFNYCYARQDANVPDANLGVSGDNIKRFTPRRSADQVGYMYLDNTIVSDTALFVRLNENAKEYNGSDHTYAYWARPGLAEINGDLPVLLLCEFDVLDAYDKPISHQGSFRSVGGYEFSPRKVQYGGPARDGNEVATALTRPAELGIGYEDCLFIYGDVEHVGTGLSITQKKVSIHEDVSILHPEALGESTTKADYTNTYVGITFDNSFRKATSTPGMNYGLVGMGGFLLPRDWHMFSTPLSHAPLGFDYGDDNDPDKVGDHINNPWNSLENEFNWLPSVSGTGSECADGADGRYWMKSYSEADGDGYFPTTRGQDIDPENLEDWFILDSDECPSDGKYRYPYGMDFYTWNEPQYHWINFKRNGPNHWHSDVPHVHLEYQPVVGAPTNKNEDELIVGRGYMAAITKETFMQSHGTLNNGPKTIPLTNNGFKFQGWNLVGNPFHSYIDFDALAADDDNKKVLCTKNDQPFYVVYNADAYGTPSGAKDDKAGTAFRYYTPTCSRGGEYAQQYVHPHQGFYVRAKEAGDLYFRESFLVDRTTAGDDGHFRNDRPAYPLVNLYLSSDQGCADVTVIEFERPEWGGAQKLKELRVGDGLFYGHHDGTYYAALFAQEGVDRVPLWFEAKEDDIFTMKWNTANADFHSMYLIDNINGIHYDMLMSDTYTFEGHKDDYPSRFLIVFNLTDVEELEDKPTVFAFHNGSEWIVTGEGLLQFIDVNGQVLWQERLGGGQSRVSLPWVAEGPYLFRLINSKETKVQKVIVRH